MQGVTRKKRRKKGEGKTVDRREEEENEGIKYDDEAK